MTNQCILRFEELSPSCSGLPAILALSIGNVTPVKLQKVLESYNMPGGYLIGCFKNNTLIGMIGFIPQKPTATIKHIAVLPVYQQQGVGRALVKQAIDTFCLKSIYAETDQDAVNFYQKLGFTCQPFEGNYGEKRYKCELSFGRIN